ncbi:type II secretion system F family protein [Paucidesulfovibrio longus]|uniref:type II secretion system F family protein n=1 Tax=Paucidesulfovibrio longus TaxID=889 RepID=UPI0003B5734D|nr:type II secretion system F family protein [Paucidesulfovibrio longus]
MPVFSYKAMTGEGSKVSGTLEAESLELAYEKVLNLGYLPSSVKQGGKVKTRTETDAGGLTMLFTKVKAQDVILFTKQLRTMLNAGIPVLQSMQTLLAQIENPRLKAAVEEIAKDITGGQSMYRAFGKHKKIFSPLYCNMLRAGEISGTLIQVLDRLIYIIEHENKVRKDIQSALTYPIIVVVALVAAFVVLIVFVLPNFIKLFKDQGVALPWPTQVCVRLHEIISGYWPIIVPAILGTLFALWYWSKTDRGRLFFDTLLLNLPILGPVFVKAAMSRFGSIFAILQSSGITVLESVDIISGTIGNAAVSKQFEGVRELLEQGRGLAYPLKKAKYFTPMLVTMVAIGEESGQLEEMLKEVAQHYDYEVEYSVAKMSELLGPVLVACLACVVGFFALAVMLPMLDLMSSALAGA